MLFFLNYKFFLKIYINFYIIRILYYFDKYLKVMFGTSSKANNNLKYKIDEINIADNWNPAIQNPKERGGIILVLKLRYQKLSKNN